LRPWLPWNFSPTKVIKYLNVKFLELISTTIFVFVYQFIICLSSSKHKLKLEVHLRYLRIHFTIDHCSSPRFERNYLTTPTTRAIFGLVQTMIYIKLPTMNVWESSFISFLSSSFEKNYLELSLKWLTSREQIGWHGHIEALKYCFSILFLR
jgi:hypothetical protein